MTEMSLDKATHVSVCDEQFSLPLPHAQKCRQKILLFFSLSSSVRHSVEEDTGYEVVSRESSSASDQTASEDDLYDQISNVPENPSVSSGSYESVGSIKRTTSNNNQPLDDYDTVGPTSPKITPQSSFGSYGVVGERGPQTPKAPDMYAIVQKSPRASKTDEITNETEDEMYAIVGNVQTMQSKPQDADPMPIICESDDDEDDEEDDNSAFVEENLDDIQDPCPPPKGESYAVDQIKRLLKDFNGDESFQLSRDQDTREITENTVVPESCEKAFAKLKDFLNQLDCN